MEDVTRLLTIQALIELRARHNRLIDTRRWADLPILFTGDFVYERPPPGANRDDAQLERYVGSDAMLSILQSNGASGITAHHACLPELEIIDAEHAEGLWAVSAEVHAEAAPHEQVYRLVGYCHDTYRKVDGAWRFASIRLERLFAVRRQPELCPAG